LDIPEATKKKTIKRKKSNATTDAATKVAAVKKTSKVAGKRVKKQVEQKE
jgi:hypothetical protein